LKIVLDTNVLVSGIFFSGAPNRILEAWNQGAFELVISPDILEEYRRVAAELHEQYASVDIGRIMDLILRRAQICMASPLDDQVCTDPDDDKFLACALAAGVRMVVSGDKSLLNASGYNEIEVMRPRAFADKYL